MILNRISIGFLLFVASQSLFSQSISNVQTRVEGNTIVVSYLLESNNPVYISLYVSEDGGRSFSAPLKGVSGDVGGEIQQGSKYIVWDVLKEREFLNSSNLIFRVKAVSLFGTFHDPRDGKTYKTVKIGTQVWMAENLAYSPRRGNYWAYRRDKSNVATYGYLYDWRTARNVCPTGWHLPSDAEWTELTNFVGNNPGKILKAESEWSSNGNGTDDYGFSALPGGYRYTGGAFLHIGDYGYWWTSTEFAFSTAWYQNLVFYNNNIIRDNNLKQWGLSVRCILD